LDFGLSIAIKHNETNTSNARLRITARRAYIGGITPRSGSFSHSGSYAVSESVDRIE
jgi:hypothetical protein